MHPSQQRIQRISFLRKLYKQCIEEKKDLQQTNNILRNYCKVKWALHNKLINDYISCVIMHWPNDTTFNDDKTIIDETKNDIVDESSF